ncbi:MAG: hypothetical protein NTY44_07850, partial [Deltaproteobacteria bacterium]|nr:hypothetical protein [Deltaproteobacteria bacterium]
SLELFDLFLEVGEGFDLFSVLFHGSPPSCRSLQCKNTKNIGHRPTPTKPDIFICPAAGTNKNTGML